MSDNMKSLDTFDVGYAAAEAKYATELSATQQKLEAAEARIKASQEQEPVDYYYVHSEACLFARTGNSTCETVWCVPMRVNLYDAPVIPPDVAELQHQNEKLSDEVEQRGKANVHKNETIRELTKLLAEANSKAVPEGWQISKRATCYVLSCGNEVIATLAGQSAEENA